MRIKTVLTLFSVTFFLMIAMQLGPWSARAADVTAQINIDPDTLLLKPEAGQWITVLIKLPREYNVRDIDISSIKLEEPTLWTIGPPTKWSAGQANTLMVKFDRTTVVNMILSYHPHMQTAPPATKESTVTLRVTGRLLLPSGVKTFSGIDTIRVKFA